MARSSERYNGASVKTVDANLNNNKMEYSEKPKFEYAETIVRAEHVF